MTNLREHIPADYTETDDPNWVGNPKEHHFNGWKQGVHSAISRDQGDHLIPKDENGNEICTDYEVYESCSNQISDPSKRIGGKYEAKSYEQCRDLCDAEPSCKGFDYWTDTPGR